MGHVRLPMEFTDFMLIKAGALVFLAFCYGMY